MQQSMPQHTYQMLTISDVLSSSEVNDDDPEVQWSWPRTDLDVVQLKVTVAPSTGMQLMHSLHTFCTLTLLVAQAALLV